jgi:hypothetical protein
MKCRCGRDFCYLCGGVYMKCECCKIIFTYSFDEYLHRPEITDAEGRKDEKAERRCLEKF